jgi:hypothetical protein
MSRRAGTGNNGKLQAAVLKKCDRAYHRPQTNKQCASGSCQHACEPSQIDRCRDARRDAPNECPRRGDVPRCPAESAGSVYGLCCLSLRPVTGRVDYRESKPAKFQVTAPSNRSALK